MTVRDSFVSIYCCILPSLITKLNILNKKLCFMNCGCVKETLWPVIRFDGLDKYSVSKKCEKSPSSE